MTLEYARGQAQAPSRKYATVPSASNVVCEQSESLGSETANPSLTLIGRLASRQKTQQSGYDVTSRGHVTLEQSRGKDASSR